MHPDLLKDEHWITVVSKKKSKAKGRQHTCNAILAILKKNLDEAETTALTVEHEAVPLAGT